MILTIIDRGFPRAAARAAAIAALAIGLAISSGARAQQGYDDDPHTLAADRSHQNLNAYETALKLEDAGQFAEALPIFRAIAAQGVGNEIAQLETGHCYIGLARTKSDPTEARLLTETGVGWILIAGEAGLRAAQAELVGLYLDGKVFIADPVEAGKWYLLWKSNRTGLQIGQIEFDPQLGSRLRATLTSADWDAARERTTDWIPTEETADGPKPIR
jgi:hypothetical protein